MEQSLMVNQTVTEASWEKRRNEFYTKESSQCYSLLLFQWNILSSSDITDADKATLTRWRVTTIVVFLNIAPLTGHHV